MANSPLDVAIIGAGLSGLALALALHQQSISCAVYEAREAPLNVGGALMLMPNGLKVLGKLGVYDSLQKRGYNFEHIYIQDVDSGKILEKIDYGNVERYGFQALRLYRYIVLEELLVAVKAKGIPIHFNKRFSHIVSETEDSVSWQFHDGSTETASLLIGADGIHSTVRSHLFPDIKPVFANMAAIVAAIPTAQLSLPPPTDPNLNSPSNTYPIPSGLTVPGLGAFVIAPQTHAGDEVMITVQRPMASTSISSSDKDALRSLLRQNSDRFPPIVQNAVREIPDAQLRIWHFYHIPRLERWMRGRVLIVGDSAHAIPPSGGQGANMAFEDVYLVALVLGRLGGKPSGGELERALLGWQRFRQRRVDRVLELNRQMDLRRMPSAGGGEEEEKVDMAEMFDWLFNIDFEEAVDECLEGVL
ncbi:FAD dependent oxidoreductase [Mollisia scopiformis]|uniref:FAD dependent oxidoreductase n=1 Tax=Mollisia scopiformis TaxID=149040 RepID=A0A194X8P3_MOLSC|nr:FAD dependent oxidoreductase [Mollisia scopiformis]KUJ16535.1 FAD dependent oxidoreductase [Mollisia scopiformis]